MSLVSCVLSRTALAYVSQQQRQLPRFHFSLSLLCQWDDSSDELSVFVSWQPSHSFPKGRRKEQRSLFFFEGPAQPVKSLDHLCQKLTVPMWNGENQSIRVTSDQNDNIIFLNDPIETNKSFQASSKYNLGGFNSIKDLFERISETFKLPTNEILYCTLNSHDPRAMENLLANYLSMGDTIIVHLVGDSEILNLVKTQDQLGLTITDNGHGRAFVKRVNSKDGIMEKFIKPGDNIAAINERSVLGMRHYEVAKALRQIEHNSKFTIKVIRPHLCDLTYKQQQESDYITKSTHKHQTSIINHPHHAAPLSMLERSSNQINQSFHVDDDNIDENKSLANEYLSLEDLADSSLPLDRLLSRSSVNSSIKVKTNHETSNKLLLKQDVYRKLILQINSILESFIGINDDTLAVKIYRLARDHQTSKDDFSRAIAVSELNVFNFGPEIEDHLWNCVNKAV